MRIIRKGIFNKVTILKEETMKENKDGTHIGELLLAAFLHAFVKNFMSEEL